MTGVAPTNAFPTPKSQTCVPGSEQIDKDRQQTYLKPMQQPVEPFPVNFASIPSLTNPSVPRYGTFIPNRIFVGGIDFKTKEEDLQKFFSAFGRVKHTNIKRDRAEISKGFGFVTFESAEEANKVREQVSMYLPPEDIHIPGPPGSWVIHPAGYASFTNPSNGITYFLDYSPPMMTSVQQPQNFPHSHGHGHVMTYGAETYPAPLPTHYTSYTYPATYSGPTYNTLHLPYAPIGGACGQLIAPAPSHSTGVEPVNVLPMTSAIPAPSYIVPRTVAANAQSLPVVSSRHSEAVSAAQEKAAFLPPTESVRMLVPTSGAYVHPSAVPPPFIHSPPTALYAQPVPLKCAHTQFVAALPENSTSVASHCDVVMPDIDAHSIGQAMENLKIENEIMPPHQLQNGQQ
ncbi:unnamed protein product [Clavelina lepadiformis]|uniref:RRM domain-containing protein n=1 Tax=Clavelina lepadiformis TaxID=159417 RepID=A0ABP0F6Q4_CLALP